MVRKFLKKDVSIQADCKQKHAVQTKDNLTYSYGLCVCA